MFAPKVNTYVDNEISRTITVLQGHEPNSKEYGETLEQLQKLQKIRQEEKPDRLSTDAMFQGFVSILGIGLILQHEHLHPITSKALSFIRLR